MTHGRHYEAGKELPTTIILRADKTTPFHLLNRMITACQENGFRKFRLEGHGQKTRGPIMSRRKSGSPPTSN